MSDGLNEGLLMQSYTSHDVGRYSILGLSILVIALTKNMTMTSLKLSRKLSMKHRLPATKTPAQRVRHCWPSRQTGPSADHTRALLAPRLNSSCSKRLASRQPLDSEQLGNVATIRKAYAYTFINTSDSERQ